MNSNYPYLCFLGILKKGREELVQDSINCHPDLYMALYKDMNSEVHKIYIELYELRWIEGHWIKLLNDLEKNNFIVM